MKIFKNKFLSSFLLFISLASWAGDLPVRETITIKPGKPFFVTMTEKGGVCDVIDKNSKMPFKIASFDTIEEVSKEFDPKVYKEVLGVFSGSTAEKRQSLRLLLDWLAKQKEPITPQNFKQVMRKGLTALKLPNIQMGLAPFKLSTLLALASGSGVAMDLGNDYTIYHSNYLPEGPEETLADAVKTGRSSSDTATTRVLDASDPELLGLIDKFLRKNKDPEEFHRVVMNMLLKTDMSGLAKLDDLGRQVALDFLTVYSAEFKRHFMSGLGKSHPWENDLLEALLLSSFVVRTGKMASGRELIDGTPRKFFGVGSGGSGIGITRNDRRALQRAVSKTMEETHPQIVADIKKVVPVGKDGDLFKSLSLFLNNFETQKSVKANADGINKAMGRLMKAINEDHREILNYMVKNNVLRTVCDGVFSRQ